MSINAIIDESAKQVLIENLYKGKGYINTLDPVPVETYAEMQVSAADTIIAENIKENETILGITGNYTGEGQGYKLTYKNDKNQQTLNINQQRELHNGDSINIEDLPEGDFMFINGGGTSNPRVGDIVVFVNGEYNGINYVNKQLSFDGIILHEPMNGDHWNKEYFESDATIQTGTMEVLDVIYERNEESDLEFDLYPAMGLTPIQPGSTIQTEAGYRLQITSVTPYPNKFKLYINGIYCGQDEATFTLQNIYIINGKAKIKVIGREFIDYQLDPNTNTETELYTPNPFSPSIWMAVSLGAEIYPTSTYKITTQDNADIYINNILVAEDKKEVIIDLDEREDLIEGKEHFVVKAISETPTPPQPTGTLTINNTSVKPYNVIVKEEGEQIAEVTPGNSYELNWVVGKSYVMESYGGGTPCNFTGKYKAYSDDDVDVNFTTSGGAIVLPGQKNKWTFSEGDHGTLTYYVQE